MPPKKIKRKIPDLIEAYLEFTANQESTDKCKTWAILSVIAGCLGRRVWIPSGHFNVFPNLYVVLVGKSGVVRKSTTLGTATDLLRSLPDFSLISERFTVAALLEQFKDSEKGVWVDGRWEKHSNIYLAGSELTEALTQVHGDVAGLLTTLFDNHDIWTHATRGGGRIDLQKPCLNIFGASTQEWLRKIIPEREMAGGFSSRFVFVIENNPPEKLIAWPEDIDGYEEKRLGLLNELEAIRTYSGPVVVHKHAKEFFAEWYRHHRLRVEIPNEDNRFSGYFGRKGDIIKKVAILRSVSCREDLIVRDRDIIWAKDQVDALEPDMFQAFGRQKNKKYDFSTLVQKIDKLLRTKLIVEEKEIRATYIQGAQDVSYVEAVLTLLEVQKVMDRVMQKKDGITRIWVKLREDARPIDQVLNQMAKDGLSHVVEETQMHYLSKGYTEGVDAKNQSLGSEPSGEAVSDSD